MLDDGKLEKAYLKILKVLQDENIDIKHTDVYFSAVGGKSEMTAYDMGEFDNGADQDENCQ